MTEQSILITGPSSGLEPWLAAARQAGWIAHAAPFLQIEERDVDLVQSIDGLPDWLAITSSNALPTLERAAQALPELRTVPLAVVGEASAGRAKTAGFKVTLSESGRKKLADALLARTEAGDRVLWPHGSVSDDFGELLRESKLVVDDPVVYDTVSAPPEELPRAEAIFFASPSGVRTWREHFGSAPDRPEIAIAIGPTTFDVFAHDDGPSFTTTLCLSEPQPKALATALSEL